MRSYIDSPSELIECEDGIVRVRVAQAECNPLPYEDWFAFNVMFANKSKVVPVTGLLKELQSIGYRIPDHVWEFVDKRNDVSVPLYALNSGIVFTSNGIYGERDERNNKDGYSYLYNGPLYSTTSYRVFMQAARQKMFPKTLKGQTITITDKDKRYRFTRVCDEDNVEDYLKKLKAKEGAWRLPTFEELLNNNRYNFRIGRPMITCERKGLKCKDCRFNKSCRWQDGPDDFSRYNDAPDGEKMFL